MTPDAYKNALLLTARVTAGLAIGCGGSVSTPTVETPNPSPDPVTTAPPPTHSPEPDPAQQPVGLACDPPQTECCNAIFDRIEKDWSQYSKIDYRVIAACCKQEDPMYTRAACTPWGPPMPPSMLEIA